MAFPPLSQRLECVLGLLSPCACLADVGTDHGLLPVAAVSRGVATRALAIDLREAPLAGARAYIERAGIAAQVVALRADGLSGLTPHSVDAVAMAGMSGESMRRILEAAPDVLVGVQQLVVQPNQNAHLVRGWALQSGFHLRSEQMLEERGQYFVTVSLARGKGEDPAYAIPGWTTAALCELGPHLLSRRDVVASRWFERQRRRVSDLVTHDVERLKPELELWEAACRAMQAT